MKTQALFSSKDKSKKLKCCLLQCLFGSLRVTSMMCFQTHCRILLQFDPKTYSSYIPDKLLEDLAQFL